MNYQAGDTVEFTNWSTNEKFYCTFLSEYDSKVFGRMFRVEWKHLGNKKNRFFPTKISEFDLMTFPTHWRKLP